MTKALRFLQITAEYQGGQFFTVFLTIKTSSQNMITLLQISPKLHEHRGSCWRKMLRQTILEEQFPVCGEIAASVISEASFRSYDNSDVIATLIILNFHLYLIQLWWQFFQIIVYGDVVYAQTLKNCIEPP